MKIKFTLAMCFLCIGMAFSSCSSQSDETVPSDQGVISLSITANTAFTRAVSESSYSNVDNYTIQILDDAGDPVQEFAYAEKPERISLKNGTYTLKAFYGTESDASRDGFYVEGNTSFNIDGNVQQVTVACKPTCGKVIVNFASEMAEYFSNYSVVYETVALKTAQSTAIWQKDDTEPWYLKVDKKGEAVKATIHFTRLSDNKSASVEKTYTMAPGKSWTLNIAPQDNNGDLGIQITVDESTDDEIIDIEVPSEWV